MRRLIDHHLPRYQFVERHQRIALARPAQCYQALLELDMSRSPVVKALGRLRELPMRLTGKPTPKLGGSLGDMLKAGFILLEADPPGQLVLGLAGKFWRPVPRLVKLPPASFASFDRPDMARVAMCFEITPVGRRASRLFTETRIQCHSPAAKRYFGLYWSAIGIFSGLIRWQCLTAIKLRAEKYSRMETHS